MLIDGAKVLDLGQHHDQGCEFLLTARQVLAPWGSGEGKRPFASMHAEAREPPFAITIACLGIRRRNSLG